MKKKIVFRALIVLFACVFVLSAVNITAILIDTAKTEKFYENLQSNYVKPITPPLSETDGQASPITELTISVDFDDLLKKNKDIVGWLYLPNTVLSYPVCQAEDNDKYLRRDLSGKRLTAGTLFADYRCGDTGTDANYIIYGHNMRNGTMFKTVTDYKKQSFYDSNPVFYYLTPDKNYKIEPILGLVIPNNDALYDLKFSKAEMFNYINSKKGKSTFSSTVSYTEEDCFITLSTCSKEYENARFVLICKTSEVEQ